MKKNLFNLFGVTMLAALVLSPNKSNAQVGAALNFDGTNDNVNLGTVISTSLANSQALTLESWIRPSVVTGTGAIVNNHSAGTQFCVRRDADKFNFFIGFGAYGVTTAVGTATANVWQHVACVYNQTILSVYINGALSATTSVLNTYSLTATTPSVQIGNDGFGEAFNGNIDEVRIWNVARTQCQINTYMNCEIPTTAAGLIANYHFNQGVAGGANPTVSTSIDASGNAYTGTLTNMALTGATSNWISPGGVVSGFTTASASTLAITSSQTVAACPGTTANLTASGGTNYAWVAPLTSTVAVATITVQVTSPTYSVAGTSTNGCAATGTFMQLVTANPVNITSSPVSTIMCTGESKTLTAAGGTAYTWQAPLTSTVAAAVISPTAAGNFTYTVLTTASVCPNYTWTTAFTQSVSGCVGIQNAASQTISFGVYPNPTSGIVQVELTDAIAASEKIKVINALGQLVIEQSLVDNKATLNMSQLNSGIYFIKIGSATKKIVKE